MRSELNCYVELCNSFSYTAGATVCCGLYFCLIAIRSCLVLHINRVSSTLHELCKLPELLVCIVVRHDNLLLLLQQAIVVCYLASAAAAAADVDVGAARGVVPPAICTPVDGTATDACVAPTFGDAVFYCTIFDGVFCTFDTDA
uniref:Uncharacterized protein n=1 Tax=Lygus hesperus TaxID=30085 RepID=A0A146M084_LYGHE